MERTEPAKPTQPTVNGRTARGEQTRERIADAVLSLLDEGRTTFPADQVAARAGVSRRLVFHHFADLAHLTGVAITRRLDQLMAQVGPLPTTGPRDVRIAELVAQRARILEGLTPTRLAVMRLENPSPQIDEAVRLMLDFARQRLSEVFATELDPLTRARRTDLLHALDAATTWTTWHHWRSSGLGTAAAARTMATTVHALLSAAAPD
ncbi:hypothetical protein GCM10020229_35200 [Kitasatospora albolonga]|uniref:TetR/AcrR family transcriptional regulator n=1 Tax=Kitasatospora albolonga TaxID=68173 RepID=UPI0031E5E869